MTSHFPIARRLARRAAAGALLAVGLAGCESSLEVPNTNDPTPDSDTEAIVASTYAVYHNATVGGSNDGLQTQMLNLSFESFSGLANFGMGLRSALPRTPIVNTLGNPTAAGNARDYNLLQRNAAVAASVIRKLNTDFTLGDAPRDERARAFAFFTNGISLGTVAMVYDSAAIVTERSAPGEVQPLSGAAQVAAAGLAQLDSAIAVANAAPAGSNGFPIPAAWIRGNSLTTANFVRLVRSYKARIRASVARTPAERAAVDWTAVLADAQNGITADLAVDMNPANGWDNVWAVQHYLFDTWHQMPPFVIGMADSSGAYATWLATARGSRAPFNILTADRRFPSGATRAAQNTASGTAPGADGRPYFRNRPAGNDRVVQPYGDSPYDFYRYKAFYDAARVGRYPIFTKAENDLLGAEAAIRLGQWSTAATLINATRVARGELPSVAGITDLTTPVPGGNACVPKVPQGPGFTTVACGNILEAMKWEKRLETAFTNYGSWYFDGRGWGDLAEGTAIQWPVPFQEMDVRQKPSYNMGGVGLPGGAPRGTYGF